MAEPHPHHDHGHNHSDHGHDHHNNENEVSFSERNRAHWDKHAATYNSNHTQKDFGDLINKVNAFILTNINWLGVNFLDPSTQFEKQDTSSPPTHQVRVLDYACGPGTITNALAGYATEYIGVDLSTKMVEQYNIRFASPGSDLNAHATAGDLLSSSGPSSHLTSDPKFTNFDLTVVGLGFHHFENLPMCTSQLVKTLKPGGVFMIVDFLTHKPNDLGDDTVHIIAHNGFSEESIRNLFTGAGLVDVEIVVMKEEVMLRGKAPRTVFMAKGRKPS